MWQKSLWRQHVTAPSVLPHRQQDECMRVLCQELSRHMTSAGSQSKPWPARYSTKASDVCLAILLQGPNPPQVGLRRQHQPSD